MRWLTLRAHTDNAQREHILATLAHCGHQVTQAARLLGVERSHLYKIMRRLGIERPKEGK